MLQINSISKIYAGKNRREVRALDRISLTLPDAGMVFFLGKSGSGKSTLLHMLGGLDEVSCGEILIDGRSIAEFKEKELDVYRNRSVGFVFQSYNLLYDFSVAENIAFSLRLQGRTVTEEEIKEVLCRVDLSGYENRRVTELSGGERQRVAIARALVKDPQMILADEPTGALDSKTGKAVFDILKECSKKKLVVVVTHDRESAEQYADRIIELSDGRIISDTGEQPVTDVLVRQENPEKMRRTFMPFMFTLRTAKNNILRKKIRFLMITVLSAMAFAFFGLSVVFGTYNRTESLSETMEERGVRSLAIVKEKKIESAGKEEWSDDGFLFSDEDLEMLSKKTKTEVVGVYAPTSESLNIEQNYAHVLTQDQSVYISEAAGFVELTESISEDFGCRMLAGRLPKNDQDEIAVSKELYRSFEAAGYQNYTGNDYCLRHSLTGESRRYTWSELMENREKFEQWEKTEDALNWSISYEIPSELTTKEIHSYEDLIGKTVFVAGVNYTITGIVDTGADRAETVREAAGSAYEMKNLLFVGEGRIKEIASRYPTIIASDQITLRGHTKGELRKDAPEIAFDTHFIGKLSSLREHEILLSPDLLDEEAGQELTREEIDVTITYKDGHASYGGRDFRVRIQKNPFSLYQEHFGKKGAVYVSESLYETISEGREGDYTFAVAAVPKKAEQIRSLLYSFNRATDGVRCEARGELVSELQYLSGIMTAVLKLFVYIAVGIMIFAGLLFYYFISADIAYKKKEIGILRAMGAGRKDICILFVCESLLIGMIVGVLAVGGASLLTQTVNAYLCTELGIRASLLHLGAWQMAVVMLLALLTATASSVLSVMRIAGKKPADIMR